MLRQLVESRINHICKERWSLESGGLSILPWTWQVDEGGGDILKRERESDNRAGALCARES